MRKYLCTPQLQRGWPRRQVYRPLCSRLGKLQGWSAHVSTVGVMQATPMEADDPTGGYMLQAGARICKSLGEEFLPYLSIVMPPLLKSAQLKPDVKVTDVDDDEDDDEDEDVSPSQRPKYLISHLSRTQ